ncbi:MAG: class I SAM-dependent methyltransferase [Solirubrobacterales bacterium]
MTLADQASDEASIWQLVESCAYAADLPVWLELTEGSSSVLDLGCGIGRVARYLAAEGRTVVGVDRDPAMVADFNRLATEEGVFAVTGDVTELDPVELGRERFGAVVAPQQLLHIVGGEDARQRLMKGVRDRLEPGGIAAFAISEVASGESQEIEILPDLREVGETVFASRPVAVEFDEGSLTVVRLRQVVESDGTLEEVHDSITLDLIDRDSLTVELASAGLVAERMIEVPETDRHIASVILVCK